MKRLIPLVLMLIAPLAIAQSQNFEGIGLSFDYSLNVITDKSTPDGGNSTSRSGIPSITVDFNKAINENFLVGAYFNYELATTDTSNTEPDAHNPYELGAKAGYAFTDSLMGYIKLGYAWSKYSAPGYSQWMRGPAYGLGVEYHLTKSIFTRVEVAQQNYRTVTWSDGSSDKVNINSYGVSLGYRF